MAQKRPEYLGDPTLARVARRPRWLFALLFALLVASGFAWLGQWQAGNAIRNISAEQLDTETPRPLSEAAEPSTGAVTEAGAGVVVQLDGAFAPDDLEVVAPRQNAGETGAWVVGHLLTGGDSAEDGANLAVAVGWAPDARAAERAIERLRADPGFAETHDLEGRYMPPEGTEIPEADQDPLAMRTMAPAYLVNVWSEVDGPVYAGYLVLHPEGGGGQLIAGAGLDPVDSVAPLPPEQVNWLNVFYAIEWVVFAGFALFLWYRLVRDAWEKEHETMLLEAEQEMSRDEE